MIPASYLYKDAYRQHWGDDFARQTGEEAWEANADAGHWPVPGAFTRIAALFRRLGGAGVPASETNCSDAMTQRYA
ncbi:MAG: hypothetical protein ACO1OG_10495 [Devosia sp.]